MSDFRKVTEDFAVSPQITVEDVRQAAAEGYKVLINNRPEGESPDQTPGREIEAAARAAGMDYHHIPVTGGPTPEQVAQERAIIDQADGPVLAYCRSGTRSIITWSIGQAMAGERPRGELVSLGKAAGYDLAGILGG
jgi:uncharacterized protein (TIGR01244 family)